MNDPVSNLNTALEGRYRVERELGEGGMATVYLARDLKHNRKVALKVLKPELAAIVGAERFLAEIETTANLTHPNILPLHDSGEVERPGGEGPRTVFYVMPYVEDETLRERLDREKQLPVDEAVRIAVEVADALEHAHRQGVIHRDIKPANILLKGGRPLVADFGIALAASRSGGGERLTETGMSLGTPYYMSPEQATGSQAVGPATDVYALGCVLYEMLVGEPPYTGSTPQAVLGKIITGDAAPVTDTRRTVPPNVEAAVANAIEKLPADRFRSAAELGRALQDPGFRHGPSVGGSVVPETRRWKAVSAALGTVALILAVGLVWTVAVPEGDREGETSPVQFTSILFPEESQPDEMSAGTLQPLALSGDGSRIVYAAEGEGGQQQLWVRPLGGRTSLRIAGTEGAASFALSPDDRWVAYNRSDQGLLERISLEGGRSVTVTETGLEGRARFYGLAWGRDGTIVFATETGLHRVPADGGTSVLLTRTDPPPSRVAIDPEPYEQHGQPRFLPDGGGVVFTRWRFDRTSTESESEVVALRFDGEPETLVRGHSPVVSEDGILVFARGDGGDLWAAELNGDGTGLTGDPLPVLDGGPESSVEGFPRALYSVSPEGILAYLPRGILGGNRESLVWADREGTTEVILDQDDLPAGASALMAMRLSPDGGRLAFRATFTELPSFRLFLYDVQRGALTSLPMDINADWPVWTPDGESIVFNRFSEDSQDLYRIRADGTGEPERFWPANPVQQHAHGFSPDGQYFVYQERPDPQHPDINLWIIPLEGPGEPRVLVGGPGNQQDAAIHPSGRWLAFVSDETGRQEVYVTEFPESRTRTRVSVDGGYSPVWSPRGGELFFRSGIGLPRTDEAPLAAARVTTDPVFRVEAVRTLFSGRYRACCASGYGKTFDVGPGGDRFVMVERAFRAGSDVPRIEIAHNWLDEVRRRLRE